MELMKNRYLKFESTNFLGRNVRNTTTLNLLANIPPKFKSAEYTLQVKVENDRLIEAISQDLYKTTFYWDLLLALNDITSMHDLPVNYDIVLSRADIKLASWLKRGKLLSGVLSNEKIAIKYKEILENEVVLNEKYRYINYISVDKLSELEAALDAVQGVNKINPKIIIEKDD